ncbi:MAG TPA: hypothetical protein VGR38_02390 [Candidatus Polarisedimenticolia bacterium]|nr:hypothetical protein [Candidatus Polarisedimenticolia bacterium]
MTVWKERGYLLSSVLLCACAVIFGTLLYPLILLFFLSIALVHPWLRRPSPPPSSTPYTPHGEREA